MSSRHPRATGAIAALAVFAVIATAAVGAPAMAAPPPESARTVVPSAPVPLAQASLAVAYPDVMAAAGDSITLAYNSASYGLFRQYSWSTGTASNLNSLRQRLVAASGIAITGPNVAQVGANSASLAGQVTSAITAQADYLTVEIGANDACTPTVAGMTSVADYQARIKAALTRFHNAKGDNRIFVASIPNLYRMWSLSKGKIGARLVWGAAKICQSMLVNPTSTTTANENRRLEVQARVNAYNAVLQQECSLLQRCTFDNYAVANYAFTSTHISTADYFHPSVEGQRVLARITWASNPYK